MQFSAQEMKLIGHLRKQERRWSRTRYILVGMTAFIFAADGCLAYFLFSTLESQALSPAEEALLLAYIWPQVLLMLVIAGAFFALAVRDWRGNVHRILLLRLLDAHQEDDEHQKEVER